MNSTCKNCRFFAPEPKKIAKGGAQDLSETGQPVRGLCMEQPILLPVEIVVQETPVGVRNFIAAVPGYLTVPENFRSCGRFQQVTLEKEEKT